MELKKLYLCISPFRCYTGMSTSDVLIVEAQDSESAMHLAHKLTFTNNQVEFKHADWEAYSIDSSGSCRLKIQFENR